MKKKTIIIQLVRAIKAALETGNAITGPVQTYIDAALPEMSPGELKQALEEGDDSEIESLMDLIFYPDMKTQKMFEPLLEHAALSSSDQQQIMDMLLSDQIPAEVIIPGSRYKARISVPDFIKEQFVDRLHMTWQIDKDLAGVIEKRVSDSNGLWLKVKLRNTGKQLNPCQNRLIGLFIKKISEDHRDFERCTDYIISVIDRISPDTDLYPFFINRKKSCFQTLLSAERFDQMMEKSNMETLMMQGFRAPHTSKQDLRLEMRLIDVICKLVFGRAEFFQRAVENRIEDALSPENDMDRVMDVLS